MFIYNLKKIIYLLGEIVHNHLLKCCSVYNIDM